MRPYDRGHENMLVEVMRPLQNIIPPSAWLARVVLGADGGSDRGIFWRRGTEDAIQHPAPGRNGVEFRVSGASCRSLTRSRHSNDHRVGYRALRAIGREEH